MKKKHQGLLSIALIVVAVGAAAGFYFSKYWRTGDFGAQETTASFATAAIPGQNLFSELRKIKKNLDIIAQPVIADSDDVELALFGYQKPNEASVENSDDTPKMPEPINYSLSFAFSSADKKLCIVDGTFYTEGNQLPDGGQILTIKPDRVLIQKDQLKKWISAKSEPENINPLALIDTTPNHHR